MKIENLSLPFYFIVFTSTIVFGCASFLETERQKSPQTEPIDPSYTWSSFFNDDCGPTMTFKVISEDEALLNYQCSNGQAVSQEVRRHQQLGEVELWVASDLPLEQLYRLSNSKCRASVIYLGADHATIKFPCALLHLTVTCDIAGAEKGNDTARLQLKPRKALITYGDGIQEFKFKGRRMIPRGPFKPFKSPSPDMVYGRPDNQNHAGL